MKEIHIDIETYSKTSLKDCGVYKYVEDEDFKILLFGYAVDDMEVKVVDLENGEMIPDDIIIALQNEDIIKYAHNSQFERVCLSEYLHRTFPSLLQNDYINPKGWRCTMVWSLYLGLMPSLADVGKLLNFDKQKLTDGKDLVKFFCSPSIKGIRHTQNDYKDKWDRFKEYNKRDVEVEREIKNRLSKFQVPESVWDEFMQDQLINDRGIMIDETLTKNAIRLDEITSSNYLDKMKKITGLDNPNSVMQMKSWLLDNGISADTLDKKSVKEMIKDAKGDTLEALKLRKQLSKTAIKKYKKIEIARCKDNRLRGMFRFYGANRTGRFSGNIVQLQNLYRNSIDDLDTPRELIRKGEFNTINTLYDEPLELLAELIRTVFIPKEGYKIIVADFSSIEARVLAYISDEKWKIKAFDEGKDIYCATASNMFKVPVEKHGINGELRQKGKIAELAASYGGAVGAMKNMGALEMGLKVEELPSIVKAWRDANPQIVKLWSDVDNAIKKTLRLGKVTEAGKCKFIYKSKTLFIELPSGRQLAYSKPKITYDDNAYEIIQYEGIGNAKKWEQIRSYGAKFVENITQAIARDILTNAINNLKDERIVAHIHDEVIVECEPNTSVDYIVSKMTAPPKWMPNINLKADGYECQFYKKD